MPSKQSSGVRYRMTARGFRQSCRYHFRFLIDECQFLEEPLPDYQFRNEYRSQFASSTTRVIIEGVHYGSGVDVAIGPYAPMIDMNGIRAACNDKGDAPVTYRVHQALKQARKDYAPQFYLDDILAIRRPDLTLIKARKHDLTERGIQKRQLRQYAGAVRECCGDLLRGDFSDIKNDARVRRLQHLA